MSARALESKRTDGGFSLVELLVAMLVTLIVSGAIYGLLASGGNAFRREPALADRQQSARMAMDAITHDASNAGAGLPMNQVVFTKDDSGTDLNAMGPVGTITGANSDVIEILGAEDRCPNMTLCPGAGTPGAAGDFAVMEPIPSCRTEMMILTDNINFAVQPVDSSGTGSASCPGGDPAINGRIKLRAPVAPWTLGAALVPPSFMYAARVVRYQIGPDPTDPGTPVLWRSNTGRYGNNGAVQLAPTAAGFPSANNTWQIVARGIEDLQVRYQDWAGAWADTPPDATVADRAVRQVQITIAARATEVMLQGAQSAPSPAPAAVRGQLVTTITPRMSLVNKQIGGQFK